MLRSFPHDWSFHLNDACEEKLASAAALGLLEPRALRVLVVDDNKDAADSMCTLTELWGHKGMRVYDGFAALDLLETYRPDVMLLDIGMPRMDGCRLARVIRAQPIFRRTLLIAVTGHTDQATQLLCAKAGFDDLLLKPADPATIREWLLLRWGGIQDGRVPACWLRPMAVGAPA